MSTLGNSDDTFGSNRTYVSSCMMEESPSYGSWMAAVMRTHLKGHVLEVGCGPGYYTGHYADLPRVERVTGMDLDPGMVAEAQQGAVRADVDFRLGDANTLEKRSWQSIVCANVVEHIEDDCVFVGALAEAVAPGGGLALLVPAHPSLFCHYDLEAGHYRRYTRRAFRSLVDTTGLQVDRLFFFNMLGAMGWFYAFKLRQRSQVSEQTSRPMIRIFERYFLPVGRVAERVVAPPFGLSLVALCRRPA
jgi:SAM-dependent methyltransferase